MIKVNRVRKLTPLGVALVSITMLTQCSDEKQTAPKQAAQTPTIEAKAPELKKSANNTAIVESEDYGPFTPSTLPNPPKDIYDGPLWKPATNWPQSPIAPPANPPWSQVLNGEAISKTTANEYMLALKDYITPAMKTLIYDYDNWNSEKEGWYSSPWMAPFSEPIRGTYVGSSDFPADMFPKSGLTTNMATHVLTLYDNVAANTMYKMWSADATNFSATNTSGQFAEGSIIVKPALTTASGAEWPPIEGAQPWNIYAHPDFPQNNKKPVQLSEVYLFQFDIIVKDSVAAPETGWVFSTLVYDKRIQSLDPWDKMIPLGAMWGNDPTIMDSSQTLNETWINPNAPLYATETLGYGGRLSGPNDGSVVMPASIDGQTVPRIATVSCMGCHLTAEYPMNSFLLPSPPNPAGGNPSKLPVGPTIVDGNLEIYAANTAEWATWFTNPQGDEAKDAGTIALDYGMNTSFKAVPVWLNQLDTNAERKPAAHLRNVGKNGGTYHGRLSRNSK